jgi:hypothetical protein
MPTKQNRCWPGYEPVRGKKQHEQGSCRPKSESKLSSEGFRKKRRKQLDDWQAKHPHSRRSAAQHLGKPVAKKKSANSKR